MVFRLANTYQDPGSGSGAQRGFAAPGAGAQSTGDGALPMWPTAQNPERPTKGKRSWAFPWRSQTGQPTPENAAQARPVGSMPQHPIPFGLPVGVWTPYYDRGSAAIVQNFGKVLTNPIGAGIVANYRQQPSYGPAGVYENGAIWWVSQLIPTSTHLSSLQSAQALAAQLGMVNVQAVVRTTG